MEEELIPGLPNELAIECLVRVPPLRLYKVGKVLKQWKSAAASPYFTHRRRQLLVSRSNNYIPCKHGNLMILLQEGFKHEEEKNNKAGKFMRFFQEDIKHKKKNKGTKGAGVRCRLILYDIEKRVWMCQSLEGIFPAASLPNCRVVSVTGEKLVVMGELRIPENPSGGTTSVWVYDFSKEGEWREGAPMPGPRRLSFAYASDGVGTIFVAGGWTPVTNKRLRSAMAYDVEMDEWSSLPPMLGEIVPHCSCYGTLLDNAFLVISTTGISGCGAETFDLTTFSWSKKYPKEALPGHETNVSVPDDLKQYYGWILVP